MTSTHCEIAQLGAVVLRQLATHVPDVHHASVQQLIKDMHTVLSSSEGVGLAAPQIGVSQQLVIIASRPTKRYPLAPTMSPTVMINPSFQTLSDNTAKDWEGCLSIPGIRALVPRYTDIMIHYTNQYGVNIILHAQDFVARVFQHEYDHLNGMVYLDRVESTADIMAESEYFKLLLH
ncbi:peptide deformylase [Crenothrix polyspora]|jgi:peptide deformylase|uniref:Peptide deformylase n=1 Tax=Crenothrix polyspora TaxID=360316 RepID=A0A1R4H930_9GAMM|nr:peptide deformylase [Crenothrix polyspora]SJM92723.1 Peptide deformylase 2 [Crenothrix polyspora]